MSRSLPTHIRKTLTLGLPLVGSQLAQFSIQIVDTIMLGWYSVEALAASVLASGLFFVIFIVGAGFAFAVMPMVAQAEASGDQVRVRRVTRMGFWLSMIYAVIVLPAMIWSGPILRMLGQDPDLAQGAQDYLRIAGFGLFPALLMMVLKSYLAALERTQVVLWVTVIAVFVNAGLNYVLIFGNFGAPELGLRGAAIASVAVQVFSLILLAIYAAYVLPHHDLFRRFWRPDPEAFGEVFRLGWPIGLTNLAETGMFEASVLIVGLFGTLPLAAHGIALQISAATFMVHIGLSQAATIRVGHAVGSQDQASLRRVSLAAVILSAGMVCFTIALFLSIPEALVSAFISPQEPRRDAIIAIGVTLIAMAALFQAVDAGQAMALGLLRGLPDTKIPMWMAAVSYWGMGIPACYLLGITFGFGAVGVWLGLVIGLAAASVLLWWRYILLVRAATGTATTA